MIDFSECLYGWSFFSSKCYRIYKQIEGLTWLDAEALCGREGGHLVSMDTETETMFIHRLLTEDISNVINSTQISQRALEDTDLNHYIGEHIKLNTNEPRHKKTNVLHMRKQRRRSASR